MKPNIYWIPGPWPGKLAILARPRGGDWLSDEVEGWREAGVQVVVSLLSEHEASEFGLHDEPRVAQQNGLSFISFPIEDYSVPASEESLRRLVTELDDFLDQGCNVGVHCRGGIGRSSLVAACLLVNCGHDVNGSFERIRNARGVAIPDTIAQREWVGDFARASASAGR